MLGLANFITKYEGISTEELDAIDADAEIQGDNETDQMAQIM
jgi:hypothetical protein